MSCRNVTKEKKNKNEIKTSDKILRVPNPIYFKRQERKKNQQSHQYAEVCGEKKWYIKVKIFILGKK